MIAIGDCRVPSFCLSVLALIFGRHGSSTFKECCLIISGALPTNLCASTGFLCSFFCASGAAVEAFFFLILRLVRDFFF